MSETITPCPEPPAQPARRVEGSGGKARSTTALKSRCGSQGRAKHCGGRCGSSESPHSRRHTLCGSGFASSAQLPRRHAACSKRPAADSLSAKEKTKMAVMGRELGAARRPWYSVLYIQVLIAIAIGILLGHSYPQTGVAMKPLGDAFIQLIKMMIAPIIFCTVVHGIASMSDLSKVGRVGLKALLYFEVVSTIALGIGLLVGELVQPGSGFNIDPATLDPKAVASYVSRAKEESIVAHLMAIIPNSFLDGLVKGDLLQVLLIAILSGFAVARMGKIRESITHAIDTAGKMFFRIIGMIVRLAPIGAFGAMAF